MKGESETENGKRGRQEASKRNKEEGNKSGEKCENGRGWEMGEGQRGTREGRERERVWSALVTLVD